MQFIYMYIFQFTYSKISSYSLLFYGLWQMISSPQSRCRTATSPPNPHMPLCSLSFLQSQPLVPTVAMIDSVIMINSPKCHIMESYNLQGLTVTIIFCSSDSSSSLLFSNIPLCGQITVCFSIHQLKGIFPVVWPL